MIALGDALAFVLSRQRQFTQLGVETIPPLVRRGVIAGACAKRRDVRAGVGL